MIIYDLHEDSLFAGIETVGKNVLVAGRSKNVGMPIAMLLHTDRNHERPGGESACASGCVCPNEWTAGRHWHMMLHHTGFPCC